MTLKVETRKEENKQFVHPSHFSPSRCFSLLHCFYRRRGTHHPLHDRTDKGGVGSAGRNDDLTISRCQMLQGVGVGGIFHLCLFSPVLIISLVLLWKDQQHAQLWACWRHTRSAFWFFKIQVPQELHELDCIVILISFPAGQFSTSMGPQSDLITFMSL